MLTRDQRAVANRIARSMALRSADVAGLDTTKPFAGIARDPGGRTAHGLAQLLETFGQRQDVVATVAQSGNVDLEHVEAIVEVLAELTVSDRRPQIAVRRRQDPHVGLQDLRSADPLEFAFLEHTEELRLQDGSHLGDLVEEERPSCSLLQPSDLPGDGAREGAALMAEQLRFEERFRQRRAVHRHERLRGSGRALPEEPCDDLLAGPRLSGDEYGGLGGSDARDLSHCALSTPRI
jgi:hypothetical protein